MARLEAGRALRNITARFQVRDDGDGLHGVRQWRQKEVADFSCVLPLVWGGGTGRGVSGKSAREIDGGPICPNGKAGDESSFSGENQELVC